MPDKQVSQSQTAQRLVLGVTVVGLCTGAAAWLAGQPGIAHIAWAAATAVALLPLTYTVVRALAAGRAGVDIIALLAMVGALALHQYLAGAVI
ncbi:MAG: heavy metal translocating P-type ATPase, partial [Bryobacteraceae bacterium]